MYMYELTTLFTHWHPCHVEVLAGDDETSDENTAIPGAELSVLRNGPIQSDASVRDRDGRKEIER